MQRAQEETQTWTQDMNQDTLVGGGGGGEGVNGDDDFTKFLELENDFSQFDSVNQQTATSGLDTPMGRLTFGQGGDIQALAAQHQAILENLEMNMDNMPSHMSYQHMQQIQQNQAQQYQHSMYQPMQHPYQVPPTPISTEIHANKYSQAIDANGHMVFDPQNASFTPLESPAQTPLENPWGMPDYMVGPNDDFFSPLTSPAIDAQPTFVSTNATSSPVDLSLGHSAVQRKSRKKLTPTSRVASVKNLRSSPATKAVGRRRQNSLETVHTDSQYQDADRQMRLHPGTGHSAAISSEDSVSPESLSESLMRPPPLPHSRTPNILHGQSRDENAPVTPATLMKLPGKHSETMLIGGHAGELSEVMEDIALPAAADVPSRVLPEINTRLSQSDGQSTPTLSVKTPKLNADSTPRSSGPRPLGNSSDNLPKPSRGGRTGKKRQSISQATISPALRPKISPSISPLVPNTGSGVPILSAETSALYLASKSNYQNIIDGTHLPGVSYPDTLAENLSSKRTSHKIAEQGRRNRINLALKEIEALLPASIAAAARKDKIGFKDEVSEMGDKLSAQGASKASTVEMAIVYIRSLQAELQETKDKLEAAEKSLAEGNASGSQTSDQTNT